MTHLPALITDLGLILGAAGLVTLLFKKLKQPVVLGYIIAGILIGRQLPFLPAIREAPSIQIWADIGVIFLLFGLGLEFSFKKLLRLGGSALVIAAVEIGATFSLGYFAGYFLGWSQMDSIFLGGVLCISSTTIIIKAFEELGVKGQRFSGIVMGVLVIEDLVAVLLLVCLSTLALTQQLQGTEVVDAVVKFGFFLTIWFLTGIFLLPTLLKNTRAFLSEETMLVVSLGLCLFMVTLATKVGFSPALGAFMMGSVLAETAEAERIQQITKPVKDLFAAIFFVSVGMLFNPSVIVEHAGPICLFIGVIFLGKIFGAFFGGLISGHTFKNSVHTGMSLAQVGEFSFIIATLGLTMNVTSDFLYPIAIAVSAVTTFTTPYMIKSAPHLATLLERMLPHKWHSALARYSSDTQRVASSNVWKLVLKSYFYRVIFNSTLVIAVFSLVSQMIPSWGAGPSFLVALLFASPFLWALAIGKSKNKAWNELWHHKKHRGPVVALEFSRVIIAFLLIDFLILQFTSTLFAMVGVLLLTGALILVFSRRLELVYNWAEQRFLSNLHGREEHDHAAPLAPWDAHIAYFSVPQEAVCIGKSLLELAVREEFGVTIALIERGKIMITAPGREERLFPFDKLGVIGTDDQLTRFSQLLKTPQAKEIHAAGTHYSLHPVSLDAQSPYVQKTIRNSGIREQTKGLVVGVERKGQRILNPPSDMVIESGDLLWIVGDTEKVTALGR